LIEGPLIRLGHRKFRFDAPKTAGNNSPKSANAWGEFRAMACLVRAARQPCVVSLLSAIALARPSP
jgi:hypothetical protein